MSLFSFALAVLLVAHTHTTVSAIEHAPSGALTAHFDFDGFSTQSPIFIVRFSEAVDAASATDPAHYSFLSPQPLQQRDSLVGIASIEYVPTLHEVSVRLLQPTAVADQEGESYAVKDVKTLNQEAAIALTSASPINNASPSAPGVPSLISPQNSRQLQWAWTGSTDQGESPSGVDFYYYELIKDKILISNGQTSDTSLVLPVSEDGQYLLRVWAEDKVGLTSEIATSPAVSIDTTGPTIVLSEPLYTGNTATPVVLTPEEPLTYVWSTDASTQSVTISDPTIPRPLITFLKDGTYLFTLTATDALGNSAVSEVAMTYLAPFVPGVVDPIDPVVTTPVAFVDKVAEIAPRTVPSSAAESDAYTSNSQQAIQTTSLPAVPATAGVEDIVTNAAVAPTSQGWRILGMLWYWWALIVAIIVSAWLWGRSVGRSQHPDDA